MPAFYQNAGLGTRTSTWLYPNSTLAEEMQEATSSAERRLYLDTMRRCIAGFSQAKAICQRNTGSVEELDLNVGMGLFADLTLQCVNRLVLKTYE